MSGAANAAPTSTATGTARTASGEASAPKAAATATNTTAAVSTRTATKARWPRSTSVTSSGVASIVSYDRSQRMAPITG